MLRIREPCLPAPRSSFGEMSTDLHRAVGDLGPPVLEARFHYQPSMGTTDYTLVLIGFPWGTVLGTHNLGCSDDNLGWFSYLSLGIYLTVIPVPTGQCHSPASSPTMTAHPWDSRLLAAGILLTLVPL